MIDKCKSTFSACIYAYTFRLSPTMNKLELKFNSCQQLQVMSYQYRARCFIDTRYNVFQEDWSSLSAGGRWTMRRPRTITPSSTSIHWAFSFLTTPLVILVDQPLRGRLIHLATLENRLRCLLRYYFLGN